MTAPELTSIAKRLVEHICDYQRCVVAFSGGVDSVVVAKAAFLALGDNAMAVTAHSPSLGDDELQSAIDVAGVIGIQHQVIHTNEFANPAYVRNAPDRCYHCKTELYDQLSALTAKFPQAVVVNGTNTDDASDYRPGLQAAAEHSVRSPLAECGLNKQTIRELAAMWQLPVWNKPAMPCLSSRVAYGEEVTPERLKMIERAEQFLRVRGFHQLRVRYHKGDLARVEVLPADLSRLLALPLREELESHLKEIGFRFVTVDLTGFRSGGLNSLIPIEQVRGSMASQRPAGDDR